ncbi:MAG: hypothetical protein ACXWIU_05485 [Limisphaerales bacterium]
MSSKSVTIVLLSLVTLATATFAGPSADDVMKQALTQAQADGRNIFLHIGSPR